MKETVPIKGYVVWATCALFFLYEFFLRTVIGSYQAALMQDLGLTPFGFSLLSTTVFMVVYGAMQIPVGIITRTIGLKKALLLGCTACSFSAWGFSGVHMLQSALFFRILMGFGASFGFIGILLAVCEWMPKKQNGLFIGISQFIGTMGPILATGPLETLSEQPGMTWRYVFQVLAYIGAFITLLIAILVEENQETTSKYQVLHRKESLTLVLRRVFLRKTPWALALYSAFIYFTLEYFSENEGRAFLQTKGLTPTAASYLLTLSWIGYAVGCPLLGSISDSIERRKSPLVFAAAIALLAITTLVFTRSYLLLSIGFFLLGFSASGQSIAFAMTSEQFKKRNVGLGFGLNNAVIMTLCAVNAPLLGHFLSQVKTSAPHLTPSAQYQIVFSPLPMIAFIALGIAVFIIKESFCKSKVSFTIITKN